MGLSLPKSNLIFLKKCLDKWVHFRAIAAAMLKCKPLFLFILGSIVFGLIRNPIWLDFGGLANSFSY